MDTSVHNIVEVIIENGVTKTHQTYSGKAEMDYTLLGIPSKSVSVEVWQDTWVNSFGDFVSFGIYLKPKTPNTTIANVPRYLVHVEEKSDSEKSFYAILFHTIKNEKEVTALTRNMSIFVLEKVN